MYKVRTYVCVFTCKWWRKILKHMIRVVWYIFVTGGQVISEVVTKTMERFMSTLTGKIMFSSTKINDVYQYKQGFV